jgi:hypothetical protein
VRLVEVTQRRSPVGYEQFALLFQGPDTPLASQGTYRVTHPALGEFELFSVPVGRVAEGLQYEVCISRRVEA